MKRLFFIFALIFTPLTLAETYPVYFLGGQSNMEGFGFNQDLPPALQVPAKHVWLFNGTPKNDDDLNGGKGLWTPLQPGTGVGFDSDGKTNQYSNRFGPEVTFGHTLSALVQNKPIAIVKYAKGGSGIAEGVGHGSWYPFYSENLGVNQYDHFLTTLRKALSPQDIDQDGTIDTLVPAGIVWMQGESDAYESQAVADAYQANLTELMALIRAALRDDTLPIVIGKITDSGQDADGKRMDYIETVQLAQQNFVKQDVCAAFVTTLDNEKHIKDGWHYTSGGYIRLGEAFAKAMLNLEKSC